jgi:hypothetical protein
VDGRVVSSDMVLIHTMSLDNILSTALQLSVSHMALGTLPEDGNVMHKHVGTILHN